MPTHYLTKEDILIHFGDHITKKEVNKQTVGTSITVSDDQIVIIGDQRFSHLAKQNES